MSRSDRVAAGTPEGLWRPADVRSARRQPKVLAERDHRPWPLPDRRWVMGQTWENLLFAHWPVEPSALRRVVPAQIPIDTFGGSAWVGVTPFVVTGLRARGLPPVPGGARFAEVNVRTYSTLDGRPGVYFFSLDTPNLPAMVAARRTYRLPYFRSAIDVEVHGDAVRYRSARRSADGPPARFEASYEPVGPVASPDPGTFEQWATERYCLYTLDARQRVLRGDIHHPPWPLQPAEAAVSVNTMGEQVGLELEGDPVTHFSRRQDVLFWLNSPAT